MNCLSHCFKKIGILLNRKKYGFLKKMSFRILPNFFSKVSNNFSIFLTSKKNPIFVANSLIFFDFFDIFQQKIHFFLQILVYFSIFLTFLKKNVNCGFYPHFFAKLLMYFSFFSTFFKKNRNYF